MIEVYAQRHGTRCRLLVTGHAESGAQQDAVCAAVSALTAALVLYVLEKKTCRHVRYSMASGEVFLSCHDPGEGFALVMRGLSAIAAEYPEHVRIVVDDKIETL